LTVSGLNFLFLFLLLPLPLIVIRGSSSTRKKIPASTSYLVRSLMHITLFLRSAQTSFIIGLNFIKMFLVFYQKSSCQRPVLPRFFGIQIYFLRLMICNYQNSFSNNSLVNSFRIFRNIQHLSYTSLKTTANYIICNISYTPPLSCLSFT
jgi:hypothetical protein